MRTDNLRRKIIRINHWFATPTLNLTMLVLDCDSKLNISPLRTLWSLHQLIVFAKQESRNGFPKQSCPTNLFSAVHYMFVNMDSWKAGRPKNLAETSLWQARVARKTRTANLGNRQFTAKDHSNQSLICNSYFESDDVRAGLWLQTQYFTLTDSQISSSVDCLCKTREREWIPETNMSKQSFFGSALHFCEHGQLKGWPPQKPSRNFTVTGTSCLDRGRTANLGYRKFTAKIIRIFHWFATPTSNLTMFVLDCDSHLNISPLRTLWSLHQLIVFAKQREREWIPETNMSNKSFFGSALHFWEHGQLKGWPPQKPSRNFTVTGTSCLDRGRTANLGNRQFTTKKHSNQSLIHNSYFDADDVRAGL